MEWICPIAFWGWFSSTHTPLAILEFGYFPQGSLTALLRSGPFTAETSPYSTTKESSWAVGSRRLKEYVVQQ